jgi:hypothetical protein
MECGWPVEMTPRHIGEENLTQALTKALRGEPVPYTDVVHSGRLIASVLVAAGRPISVVRDGPWAGVWDLEELTDAEAAAWGIWVATRLAPTAS